MQHLLNSVESALAQRNYYAALAMALTLPDIIGWVKDPSECSKRRCVKWFDAYMAKKYHRPAKINMTEKQFLSGSDFYALRCAYLHEGRDEILEQRARSVLESFQFVVPPESWTVHCNSVNDTLQLQVDVFCREILAGIRDCLADLKNDNEAQGRLSNQLVIRDLRGNVLL